MTGTRVTVTRTDVVIEPRGLDRMWSFTRRLVIPRTDVADATIRSAAAVSPRGLRWPGLRVPGKVSGTFRSGGRREFWNASRSGDVLVIRLTSNARFERIVLTVDDPAAVADQLRGR